jgi:thiol-disulfide isomerase/thioredoxin
MPPRFRPAFVFGLLIVGPLLWCDVSRADPVGLKPEGEDAAEAEPQERAPEPAAPQAQPPRLPGPGEALPPPAADDPSLRVIEDAYAGSTPPEAVRMLLGIVRGRMRSGEGWYGPAAARYSWRWLAELHGVPESGGAIPADKFRGSDNWFARLDRDRNGRVTADDLDWSDRNPWVQRSAQVGYLFDGMEANGDGRLTREEVLAFFESAAGGKDHLLPEDLRDRLLSDAYSPAGAGTAGDMPTQAMLVRGLFAGDFGSLNEGPALDARAPDFSLKTHDAARTVRLAELLAEGKPVVLTFGNFTCGPFRYMFPGVEAVHKRFAGEATFVAVYVREAHPTGGWRMESNDRAGVTADQPTTYAERAAVAAKCHALLKYEMPLLVDEINDPVGHAYSGMPARLYVIDRHGNVAYKAGRGPFGFKPAEMEQALVMTLLDQKRETEAGVARDGAGPAPGANPAPVAEPE